MFEDLAARGFQIEFHSHATAILSVDFPDAIGELEAALGAPFELPPGWPFASAERGSQGGILRAGCSLEAPAPTQRQALFQPVFRKRARGETGRSHPGGAA